VHLTREREARLPADAGKLHSGVIATGGVAFLLLMALSSRYGFHRDELYFLDCARHLQASYVDQPVLVPLLTRVSLWLFGPSVIGLRLWPALAAAITVILGGLIARELGGGRRAQLLAALATATMPILLGAAHLMGPTAFDLPAWAALSLVAIRIDRTGDPRWWLAGGLVLGVGLTNKHSIAFYAAALVLGLLLSGGRSLVLNRWFAAGTAIAVVFTIPDIWWQAQHDWATVAMSTALNRENGGLGNVASWVVGQLIVVVLAMAWLWVAGLRFLWRTRRPMPHALVWAYAILFVFFAVTSGAKIYYLAGAYIVLLAAGAVAVQGWLAGRRRRVWTLGVATALTTVAAIPVVLPVLPVRDIGWTYDVNDTLAETVGWPQLAGTVRSVWSSLPAAQRADTVIFTSNYGEAGAINTLDRGTGMPPAVSGHNTYWWWGPGNPHATTVIAVMPGPVNGTGFAARLGRLFAGVQPAATISNPYGIRNQESGGHVYVCTGPRRPWGEMWAKLRDYA
jgi:4-amino-4-deoxy-L-arabinose transferase-like glycosyltransferase